VSFALPAGAYATMAVRELVDSDQPTFLGERAQLFNNT